MPPLNPPVDSNNCFLNDGTARVFTIYTVVQVCISIRILYVYRLYRTARVMLASIWYMRRPNINACRLRLDTILLLLLLLNVVVPAVAATAEENRREIARMGVAWRARRACRKMVFPAYRRGDDGGKSRGKIAENRFTAVVVHDGRATPSQLCPRAA